MQNTEPKFNTYANGIKYHSERDLCEIEFQELKSALEKDFKKYSPARKFGLYTMYFCIILIISTLIAKFVLKIEKEDLGTISFLFCAFLPALTGSIQEVIYSKNKIGRFIFAIPFIYAIIQLVSPKLFQSDLMLGISLLIVIFGGWIFLLLRWSDASKNLPQIKSALQDLNNKKVLIYQEQIENIDGEKVEITLETLPNCHLIYKVDRESIDEWITADVSNVSLTSSNEFLAPWHKAPPDDEADGLLFYQRKMSREEKSELFDIRKKFLRKALIIYLPLIYLAAVIVRIAENILDGSLNPELSAFGWALAVILGSIIPINWLRSWFRLRGDLDSQLVVSIWESPNDSSSNILLEEILPESGLLWSSQGKPSAWRLIKKL